jgi:hypothetical protein
VNDLCDLAETTRFDAMLLSWSNVEKLDSLGKIVKKLRAELKLPIPILVGGSIMGRAPDIETITGADLATNDLDHAMKWVSAVRLPVRGSGFQQAQQGAF